MKKDMCESRMRANGAIELTVETRRWIAAFLDAVGARRNYSLGIDGSLTAGWGRLDQWGYWEYPLCLR